MRRILVALPLIAIAALGFAASAAAQTSFLSSDGLPTANTRAKDALGDDVVAITIGTAGPDPFTGAPGFDIETGTASFWTYIHYSPSRNQAVAHALFQTQPGQYFGAGDVYDNTTGLSAQLAIVTSGAFAGSDAMAGAVRADAVYQRFRARYGTIHGILATLTSVQSPELPELPEGFPTDAPIWTVVLRDDSDTSVSLSCLVSSSTGRTACVSSVPLSVEDEASTRRIAMSVVPNPARGLVRVTVANAGRRLDGLRLGLFDEAGREVLDLTASLIANDLAHAEFDAAALEAGRYFVRAVGAGFNDVVGTVSLGR
jgi:hypothetical protein